MRRAITISTAILYASLAFSVVAGDGTLIVKTRPEGIEVWLDDKYIGDSPIMNKKLKPGRYSLKLIDPIQHTSTTEEVFIQADQITEIEKSIKAKFGSLAVTSEPEGAEVSIATSLGKTPVTNDFMNPGKYRIEIKHPNSSYTSATEDIVIPRGEKVTISKSLEKKSPFNTLALIRLGLGAGAIASYFWAIAENGNSGKHQGSADNLTDPATKEDAQNKADKARNKVIFGSILGTVCVIGFEIVAFF
ncbi:MAG: PEGA domain-containing protein [Chitinivibrionales bacterium]|nr:PEGA domain-containing protein [Chitinivibrionales bacterium]